MNKLAKRLLSEAKKEVGTGDVEIARRALQIAETRTSEYVLAQIEIVEYIIVLDLPEQEGCTLSQFLLSAGLSTTRASHLISITTVIKPFCQEYGLAEIETALTPEHHGKLDAAVSTLRRAIRDDDVEKVKSILDVVLKADSRTTVRKYLSGQPLKFGYGITVDVDGGNVVLVAKLTEDPVKFMDRLESLLDLNNGCDRTEFIRALTGALATMFK